MTEFHTAREAERGTGGEPIAPRSRMEDGDLGDVVERRSEEERQAEEERRARRAYHVEAAFWAVMGAIVVLYLFFAVLGTVDPSDAPGATIVIMVVAVIWLVHAWQRLYAGGYVSRSDRERRGF
jgi:hypothetical protein